MKSVISTVITDIDCIPCLLYCGVLVSRLTVVFDTEERKKMHSIIRNDDSDSIICTSEEKQTISLHMQTVNEKLDRFIFDVAH